MTVSQRVASLDNKVLFLQRSSRSSWKPTIEQDLNLALEELLQSYCDSFNGVVATALKYHFTAGGSRTRAQLCLASSMALRIPVDSALAMAAAVEMLHNASLIHDDLQDGDSCRRGKPTVWKFYGKNTALLCGDALINAAYGALAELDVPQVGKLIGVANQRVRETINGQSQDITVMENRWADTISLEQCTDIAVHKSGPLLALPLELTFLYAGQAHYAELSAEASMHYAIAYQFLDDIKDDIRDGKNHSVNALNATRCEIKAHINQYPDINFLADEQREIEINKLAKQKLLKRIQAHLNRAQMTISRLPEANGGILLCAINALINKLDEIH